jgi:hypothetical protein
VDESRLTDRVSWGLNVAARSIGMPTDAYRPSSASEPLCPANRFLRLHAAFSDVRGGFEHANTYDQPLWNGIFDAAYTHVGDYLVQPSGTWFIVAQRSLMPVLCVRADRIVSFTRPAAPTASGVNAYGGVTAATNTPLLTNWPASVRAVSPAGVPSADLPGDSSVSRWTVLLPAHPAVVLQFSDLLTDDLGRSAVVSSAELTELGWRLSVKQAAT